METRSTDTKVCLRKVHTLLEAGADSRLERVQLPPPSCHFHYPEKSNISFGAWREHIENNAQEYESINT